MVEQSPDGPDVPVAELPGPPVVPAQPTIEGDEGDLAEGIASSSDHGPVIHAPAGHHPG